MLCGNSEHGDEPAGWECRRPPFPVFPIVMPLIFPFGVMAMLITSMRRRRRALEARLSQVEEELAALTEKVSQAEREQ